MQHPPLHGVRVIDLTTFLSGPSATQLLAELGAEVIKVESLEGDSSRAIAGPKVSGESAYFLSNNRNKKSIALNLKDARGKEALERLIERADVLIENFRPGVMARLGLSAEETLKRQPGLVWASISGFGQQGPGHDRPAYDMVVQALSGVMSITGHKGSPAARLGIPAGDVVAGLYAVIGILAALTAKRESGRGRVIDVSMLHGQLAMLSYQAVYTAVTGVAPGPQGAGHDSIATYRGFRGGDNREFVITANTPRMWEGLCAVLGLDHLISDSRFANAAARLENKEELWKLLEARFAEKPAEEWVELLGTAQVPAALVKDVLEALTDAREADNGTIVSLSNGTESFENVTMPIRFAETPAVDPVFPPLLGEHTEVLLRDLLGYAESEVDELLRDRVAVSSPVSSAPSGSTAPVG